MLGVKILQAKRADYATEKGGGQRVVECYVDVSGVGIFKGVRVNLDTQRIHWPTAQETGRQRWTRQAVKSQGTRIPRRTLVIPARKKHKRVVCWLGLVPSRRT